MLGWASRVKAEAGYESSQGGGYGEKFQALLATIELVAPGGVCQPIKYVLFGFAKRTGSFGPIRCSTGLLC